MRERTRLAWIMRGFLLLPFLGLCVPAYSSCNGWDDLDLRSVYPEIFNHLPIRNQGSVGTCYAETAVTFIDFFRAKNSLSKSNLSSAYWAPSSSVEAAILGSMERGESDYDGGDVCNAVRAISKRGFSCADALINNEQLLDLGIQIQSEMVGKVFVKFLNGSVPFHALTAAQWTSKSTTGLSLAQKNYLKEMRGLIQWTREHLQLRGVSPKYFPTEIELLNLFQSTHLENTYYKFPTAFQYAIAQKMCTPLSVPKLNCESFTGTDYDYISRIDRHLAQKKTLIGVGYCSAMMNNPKFKYSPSLLKECAFHASVIIGKKKHPRNGQCYYLIRNSWGQNWSSPHWEVDRGDVWVSESSLNKNILQIYIAELQK